MRIRSFDLIRYGHFTDASLHFPSGGPDFHVVYGENEAGKSTTMSAIEDLLFGIPGQSSHNFLHENAALRVGATLERDAALLSVRRRKGNKDTLLGPDDLPLAAGDGLLVPLFGGIDRAFFSRMFCLDHERLRVGGRDIIQAKDDIGATLFAAGAGVSGLRDRLTAMQEEADGLWASRRAGHRKYYQAEDRLKEADTALRQHTVTAIKWQELKSAFEEARDACLQIDKEIVDFVQYFLGACVRPVDLVDHHDGRQLRLKSLCQHVTRLRQRTFRRVHQQHHTVNHLERALHLAAEISVSGCINDVDLSTCVIDGGILCQDRDATLPLKLV